MSYKSLENQTEDAIPARAKRKHPQWGDHQLLTSYILEDILEPELPPDAFATIAFTSSDLWPREGWNFVFGYASLRQRVGVWSLYRHGDPDRSEKEFAKCLARTLKVATHETGHMFSMQHCTAFQCNMQGSNSLPESDRQPLYLCPECHAKLLYATPTDPIHRFGALQEFCQRNGLKAPETYYRQAIKKLE